MTSVLHVKAYVLKKFFNFWGHLGSLFLNVGPTRGLDVFRNLPYGTDPLQRLDIFRSGGPESKGLSVLVYFHGGGWISADKKIYSGICASLSAYGYVIFNVNYRLAPANIFPAQLQDAAQAIAWIHSNAVRYGGDSSRIVLAGDSAGAQIASWYASALHKEALFTSVGINHRLPAHCLKGLLLFYGVYDFDTVLDAPFPFIQLYARSFLGADPQEYATNSQLASPIKHVTEILPPVFLCAGQRDGLYTQTIAYAEALDKSGVSCTRLLFARAQRAGHGFLFFRWLSASKTAFAAAGEFLQGLKP
jgi:acetyl esterase/lipase